MYTQRVHFYITAAFCVLSVPACIFTRLYIVLPLSTFTFLLGWAIQSIIWAALLYQFGVPASWSAYRRNSLRFVPAILMAIIMVAAFGPKVGAAVAVAGFAIAEFHFRGGDWKKASGALLPWLYLAAGIEVALYLSSVIVTLRPCTEYDAAFSRLDSLLMFGGTVARLSREGASLYAPAEFIYYSMGGVMGAAILFLCLAGDRRATFQMGGAILTAYYASLVVFFFFPAQGPFIAAGLPLHIFTAGVQRASLVNATVLYHHAGWITPPRAYYVAFPSLHVAQPLIAAWFLRRWRAVCAMVSGYCILLVPAIVILQWHYVIDIIGGLAIAVLAVSSVSVASGRFDSAANNRSGVSPVR
jgi:hypothetical protein